MRVKIEFTNGNIEVAKAGSGGDGPVHDMSPQCISQKYKTDRVAAIMEKYITLDADWDLNL